MSPESLAIRLRQARGAMSLAEAADVSEIPEERIRMYEEGVRRPYGKTLRRLAEVYGVRVPDLVGGGRVTRSRARGADVRRRRRRIVAGEDGEMLSVPLEVGEGQVVRLVIELVVRRREAGATSPGEQPGERLEAPTRLEAEVEEEVSGPPDESPVAPQAEIGRPARRRRPMPQEPTLQPRDPILDLRRAYRDFRQKKP